MDWSTLISPGAWPAWLALALVLGKTIISVSRGNITLSQSASQGGTGQAQCSTEVLRLLDKQTASYERMAAAKETEAEAMGRFADAVEGQSRILDKLQRYDRVIIGLLIESAQPVVGRLGSDRPHSNGVREALAALDRGDKIDSDDDPLILSALPREGVRR